MKTKNFLGTQNLKKPVKNRFFRQQANLFLLFCNLVIDVKEWNCVMHYAMMFDFQNDIEAP